MKRLLFSGLLLTASACYCNAQKIPAYTADKLMERVSGRDTTYIVNFWATWCGPCVAELPQFTALQERYAKEKIKVILVSFDFPDSYPAKLTAYVAKKKLAPEVVWFNESDATAFIPKIEASWSGGLPGTMIINRGINYKLFLERPVTALEIEQIVTQVAK